MTRTMRIKRLWRAWMRISTKYAAHNMTYRPREVDQ